MSGLTACHVHACLLPASPPARPRDLASLPACQLVSLAQLLLLVMHAASIAQHEPVYPRSWLAVRHASLPTLNSAWSLTALPCFSACAWLRARFPGSPLRCRLARRDWPLGAAATRGRSALHFF